MPFKNILVALDGSEYSQNASEYAFWLAGSAQAQISGIHVVDPRLIDLFIAPQFAQELGFSRSVDAGEKVAAALGKIGKEILDLFSEQAIGRGFKTTTLLTEGHVVSEIIRNSEPCDLLVMGHHGIGKNKMPTNLMLGSVAERTAVASPKPVLIAVQPLSEIKQILVAYDGSETSRGALLMAENLAMQTNSKLKALTVVPSASQVPQGHLLMEEGESYLREKWKEKVFSTKSGPLAGTILQEAADSHSLLVLGAYGFKDPNRNVLGRTTTKIVRQIKTSVLIYKSALSAENKSEKEVQELVR